MSNPGSGDKFRSDLGPARKDLSFTNPEDTGDLEQFVNRLRDFAGAHNSVALLRDVIYNPEIKADIAGKAEIDARRLLQEEIDTLENLGVRVGKKALTAKEFVEQIINSFDSTDARGPWSGKEKSLGIYDAIIPGYGVAMSDADPDMQEAIKCAYVVRIIKSKSKSNVYYVKYNKILDDGGTIKGDAVLENMPPIKVTKSENGTFEYTATILDPLTLEVLDDKQKINRYGNHALLNLEFKLGSMSDTKWRMIVGDTLFNLAQRVNEFKDKKLPMLGNGKQQLVVPSWLGTGTGKSWIQGIGAALWGSSISILPDTNLRAEQTSEYVASICVTTGMDKADVKKLVAEGIPEKLLKDYQSTDAGIKASAGVGIKDFIQTYPFITMTTDEFVIVQDLLSNQYLLFDEAHTLEKDEYFQALQKVAETNLCFLMTATPRSKLISYCKEIGSSSIYTYTLGHAFEQGNVRSVDISPLVDTTLKTGKECPVEYDSPEMALQLEQLTDQAGVEFFSKSMMTKPGIKGHTEPGPVIGSLLRGPNISRKVQEAPSTIKKLQMTFSRTASIQQEKIKRHQLEEAQMIAMTIRSIANRNEARLAFEKGFTFSSDPNVRELMVKKYGTFHTKAKNGQFLHEIPLAAVKEDEILEKEAQMNFIARCYSASIENHLKHDEAILNDPEVILEIRAKYGSEAGDMIKLVREQIFSVDVHQNALLEKAEQGEKLSLEELAVLEQPLIDFSRSMQQRLDESKAAHVRSAIVSEVSGLCLGVDSKNMLEQFQFEFAGEGDGAALYLKKQLFGLMQEDKKDLLSNFRSPKSYAALRVKLKEHFGPTGSYNALSKAEQAFIMQSAEEQLRRFLVMVHAVDTFSAAVQVEMDRIDKTALNRALAATDKAEINSIAESIMYRVINPNKDHYITSLNDGDLLRDQVVNMLRSPVKPAIKAEALDGYQFSDDLKFSPRLITSYLAQSVVLHDVKSHLMQLDDTDIVAFTLPKESMIEEVNASKDEANINVAKQRLRLGLCMTAISDHTFSTGLSIADATRVQQVESGWGVSSEGSMSHNPEDMLTCMPAEEAQLFGRVVRDKYLMSTASQHVPDWFAPYVFNFKECQVKDFVPRLEAGYEQMDHFREKYPAHDNPSLSS